MKKDEPTIRDLYPHLSDAELVTAENNIERYLALVLRIFDRMEAGLQADQLTEDIRCECCRLFLVGEYQKGRVYYRCHRRTCPTTVVREDRLESSLLEILKCINIVPHEEAILADFLKELRQTGP